jgi:hypothetical protein
MSKPMEPRIRLMLLHDRAVNEAENPKQLVEATQSYGVLRYIDKVNRWPDEEFDTSLGRDLQAIWNKAGQVCDAIEWKFPLKGKALGNDYPNPLYFIKKQSGLHPSTRLAWDGDRLEVTGSYPVPV